MRNLGVVFAAALFVLCRSYAYPELEMPGTTASPDVAREEAVLRDVFAKSRSKDSDFAALAAQLKAVIADPAFSSLPENEKHFTYYLYAVTLYNSRDKVGAHANAVIASEMSEADKDDWTLRLVTAHDSGDDGDAAVALAKIARTWPFVLAVYGDDFIITTANRVNGTSPASSQTDELLEALYADNWQPKDPFKDADPNLMSLVRSRIRRGDIDGARKVAQGIQDPDEIMEMLADETYNPVTQADLSHFDANKALERWIADRRAKSAAARDKLEGVHQIADWLLRSGKVQESLQLLDEALSRPANSFSDYDAWISWVHDLRSRALWQLGRRDDALAALASGAEQRESGGVNVSQTINLGDAYDDDDKPKEALVALAPLIAAIDTAKISPYGKMALADAKACAYSELGDKENLSETLAYMRDHLRDGEQSYFHAMQCTGDTDALAADIISQLADPSTRTSMLSRLQDYLPNPNPTPRENKLDATLAAVLARADVKAAVEKVGRIMHLPVSSVGY